MKLVQKRTLLDGSEKDVSINPERVAIISVTNKAAADNPTCTKMKERKALYFIIADRLVG